VPVCRRIHTWRRKAHNQPMSSVTSRAPRPQVLQQIPSSDAPDWHATLPITRLRGADPGGPRKTFPLPNTQRFPHLETGSHSYARRVCPRLENAPKTTATNIEQSHHCLRTTTHHVNPMMKNPPGWPRHQSLKYPPPHSTKTVLNPSTLKENNWWDNTLYTSGTVMGGVRE